MKKLLHERLREYENNIDFFDECLVREKTFIETLYEFASEIEFHYIPLPCDPDEQPWKIGDEAISGEGETFIVQGVGYTDGLYYLVNVDSGTVYDAEWCKRPQPKILDADGIEIKVGDTVWSVNRGTKYRIFQLHEDGTVDVTYPEDELPCGGFDADKLTHKEPDSLDSLLDDMFNHAEASGDDTSILNEWIKRLSALIERGV